MKTVGVYIHIPFCKQKCIYCDFISFANNEEIQERYISALIKEIKNWKLQNKETIVDTIYIGGGTPSFIDSKYIVKILDLLSENKTKNSEVTIEVNPGTVTLDKLKDYINIGINRLSIGLQSTDNKMLELIGRIHTFEEFKDTFNMARSVGFENINVDLMIGLPSQTIEDVKKMLEKVISFKPEHISVYSLIIEEDTVMQRKIDKGELQLPSEEIERNMYWYVKNTLELNKYNHYEISNFAKEEFESKHNANCWNQKEYRGFGLGSHSYINKVRFSNIENIDKYIGNIEKNKFNDNVIIQEEQTEFEEKKEYMLLGLRKIDGVSIQEFKKKFIDNPIFLFKDELNKLSKDELILIDKDRINLTPKGLNLANLVWKEFI